MIKIARVNIEVGGDIEMVNPDDINGPLIKQSLEPTYAHKGDAGFDFRANITEPVTIQPFQRHLFKTGVKMEIPEGYEVQIRPRSGLALKHGITVLNTPATIDSCFRGEIGVILINLSTEAYTVQPGEKIAQGVLKEFVQAKFQVGVIDKNTDRGTGEYGSSGKF